MARERLDTQKVKALERLNKYLTKIEKRILNLGLEFKNEILALEPHDWDLKVVYEYTTQDDSKVQWIEFLKHQLEEWQNPRNDEYWGIADGNDHNVSRFIVSGLEHQKHCYLMHQLYDDFHLSWNEILALEWMWLDFELCPQFKFYLGKHQKISEMEKRLKKIEKFLYSKIKAFQRKARHRILSGEPDLYDYELMVRISFYEKREKELKFCISWEDNIKHRNPFNNFWVFSSRGPSQFLDELMTVLEDMRLKFQEEELLRFNHLSVDLILKYQYRFPMKEYY